MAERIKTDGAAIESKRSAWQASQSTGSPLPRGRDLLSQGIKNVIAPDLNVLGYRKKANTFRLNHEAYVWVINFQQSQWNEAWETSFTVNLGVYFPSIDPFWGAPKSKLHPSEADCFWRERLGTLTDGRDTWWDIDAWMPFEKVALLLTEVGRRLKSAGFAWLQQHSSIQDALDAKKRGHRYWRGQSNEGKEHTP